MNKLTMLFPVLLAGYLLIGSCSQGPSYTAKTLPSGRVIKTAGIGKMHFSKGDPALMLQEGVSIACFNCDSKRS